MMMPTKKRQSQSTCDRLHRGHQELAHQGDARHGDAHDGTSLSEAPGVHGQSLSGPSGRKRLCAGRLKALHGMMAKHAQAISRKLLGQEEYLSPQAK